MSREGTSARKRTPRPYRPRVLRDAGISANKSLGQHFLSDYGVVGRIVAAAALTKDDTVIEIGPGLGVLTERLSEAAGQVVAVELDRRLAERLRGRFEGTNVTVVEADVLRTDVGALLAAGSGEDGRVDPHPGPLPTRERGPITSVPNGDGELANRQVRGGESGSPSPNSGRGLGGGVYAVVANLPYNIGAAVLRHFLESAPQPRFMVVMLQREVAASVCAEPGELGILGVSVQVYATAKRLFNVAPRAFTPPPRVTSSVIRLDVRPEPLVAANEREHFFRVLRAGFSAPRKQLANTLAQGLAVEPADVRGAIVSAGLDPTVRPSELAVEEWRALAQELRGES